VHRSVNILLGSSTFSTGDNRSLPTPSLALRPANAQVIQPLIDSNSRVARSDFPDFNDRITSAYAALGPTKKNNNDGWNLRK
jgi:hypothetical protein